MGTRQGGIAAAATNKRKYGVRFYGIIGAKGGSISRGGGFYKNPERASLYGRLGGSISRRGIAKLTPKERAARRRRFEETYSHLLAVHEAGKRERDRV